MLPGLRSDLPARTPALSSAVVRPSKLDRSHLLVTYLPLRLSCPHIPYSPLARLPTFSYVLLPPACTLSRPHCSRRLCCPVLSRPT